MNPLSPTRQQEILRHITLEDVGLRAFVRAATGGHREAEDLIQEIWVVVCTKIDSFDTSRPFRPWLMGIARLEVLKWRQSLARSREVLDPEVIEKLADTALETGASLDQRREALAECVRRLSEQGRKLLGLRYVEGLSNRAIAERQRRQVGAVEVALSRTRQALRKCIDLKQTGVRA
jgi:RNA polymerase sigma-70 factor (ECF subfamily)